MQTIEEYLIEHAVLDGMGNMDGFMVPLSVALIAADKGIAGSLIRAKSSHRSHDHCCGCRGFGGWHSKETKQWVICQNCKNVNTQDHLDFLLSHYKYLIDRCVDEDHAYRQRLLKSIMGSCESLRARDVKVPDQLGHWIDFLNGN